MKVWFTSNYTGHDDHVFIETDEKKVKMTKACECCNHGMIVSAPVSFAQDKDAETIYQDLIEIYNMDMDLDQQIPEGFHVEQYDNVDINDFLPSMETK